MLTIEEQELLTRTGPGTACGDLMRRHWQPAALSEELPPGGAPLSIRLLGEELVLFRDEHGRPGLLGLHCSHRGADLSYGRLEDGGIRCIYHGWLYDVHGRCLEQPGEPASNSWTHSGGRDSIDSARLEAQAAGLASQPRRRHQDGPAQWERLLAAHERIRHRAYPCHEQAGVVFAYLGPGKPPVFPSYEFLSVPPDHVVATKLLHECNYLQANEGNIDLSHLTFLHYTARNRGIGGGRDGTSGLEEAPTGERVQSRGAAPGVEYADAELTPYGLRSYKVRRDFGPDHYQLYLTEFVLPNLTAFPGPGRGQVGFGVNWHVPIDDMHHWKYTFTFERDKPVNTEGWGHAPEVRTEDYRPVRNRSNRYLQDRESMNTECYTGMGFNFVLHDLWATESQGPIQDRTREHLGAMDRAVTVGRKVLMKAIMDLQEGKEPANIVRDSARNEFRVVAYNGVFPNSLPWKEASKQLEDQVRVWAL